MSLALGGRPSSGFSDRRLTLKAALDRTVAFVLLLLAAVWMALIAVAIRLDSPGPVFSRERRLGRHGREFDVLRFRSTVLDVFPGRGTGDDGGTDTEVRFRTETRVGRALQRYCLNELPQLINVLRGDMSLVGPQPQDPRAGAEDGSGAPAPLPVKPGLTWLDAGGLRSRSVEPMNVDEYVRNYSLGLDLSILRRALRSGPARRDAG